MIVLLLALVVGGTERTQTTLLVFLGFCIGWVSTTIARYVNPSPKRWKSQQIYNVTVNGQDQYIV